MLLVTVWIKTMSMIHYILLYAAISDKLWIFLLLSALKRNQKIYNRRKINMVIYYFVHGFENMNEDFQKFKAHEPGHLKHTLFFTLYCTFWIKIDLVMCDNRLHRFLDSTPNTLRNVHNRCKLTLRPRKNNLKNKDFNTITVYIVKQITIP